ncbi:unnamed protein product [Debaryomyces fabryi]|nr:unnamed protein product [Debaryomyces fabryi]
MSEKRSNKRSEAAVAAAKHWSSKKRQKENTNGQESTKSSEEHQVDIVSSPKEVIVVSSEDEALDEKDNREPSQSIELNRSQIRLMSDPSYSLHEIKIDNDVNKDTILLSDLVGSKDLKETYQFNFSVDLEFFLMHLHPDMSKYLRKITFITGSRLLDANELILDIAFIKSKFNISELTADLPIRFGTHHTKMMINFYTDETCEIVIMTCNLQKIDFGGLTQMCWKSGRLHKSNGIKTPKRGALFQKDLKNYLCRYKKKPLNELSKCIDEYDFLPVNVELIASAPGFFNMAEATDESEIYGYGKLYQVLRRNNLLIDNSKRENKYNVLAQVSSISYPFATEKLNTASIFSHLLCPLIFSGMSRVSFNSLKPGAELFKKNQNTHNYKPHILYPSVEDVANSNVGFASGQALHFKYTTTPTHRNQYEQNIKPYLYRWQSGSSKDETGRENVVPHVKLYMCDNGDDWSTLRWVLMGSHNLSKQAWGAKNGAKFTNGDPLIYQVSSYELGILIPGNVNQNKREHTLKPVYGSDTFPTGERNNYIPLRMPFKLPPVKYQSSDRPWSAIINYGNNPKDRFGQCYYGLDT